MKTYLLVWSQVLPALLNSPSIVRAIGAVLEMASVRLHNSLMMLVMIETFRRRLQRRRSHSRCIPCLTEQMMMQSKSARSIPTESSLFLAVHLFSDGKDDENSFNDRISLSAGLRVSDRVEAAESLGPIDSPYPTSETDGRGNLAVVSVTGVLCAENVSKALDLRESLSVDKVNSGRCHPLRQCPPPAVAVVRIVVHV